MASKAMKNKKRSLSKQSKRKNVKSKAMPVKKQHNKNKSQHKQQAYDPENDPTNYEFVKDMIEEDDLAYLMNNKSESKKVKKRKPNDLSDDEVEQQYENRLNYDLKANKKRVKMMLPIKIKGQVLERNIEMSDDEENVDDEPNEPVMDAEAVSNDDQLPEQPEKLTPIQLLALREKSLQITREKIGVLCSNILEDPEQNIESNVRKLFNLMDTCRPEVWLFVQKLTIISLMEVFKDVLPNYAIREQDTRTTKLKKDTLKLVKFEEKLLQLYKKYLQKLDKFSRLLVRKKGATDKRAPQMLKLAETAVLCMCELLVTNMHFNYAKNIINALIPFLIHPNQAVRARVADATKTIFRSDKKGTTSLILIQRINALIKQKPQRITQDCLATLLALHISEDVNLDHERESLANAKKHEAKKHKIINMSKKERKRKKRLDELDKELLETRAEENQAQKHKCYTEITKVLFTIYFRILKQYPNAGVLSVTLEGLAKFAHLINLEFYTDLLHVINDLLRQESLGYREKLHCILTVVTILYQHGDVFNIDPLTFYRHLFELLFNFHAGNTHPNYPILLKTLEIVLVKRYKSVTYQRILSFIKRLSQMCLITLHNSALSNLNIIKQMMQMVRAVDVLLDTDQSVGDGVYQPDNLDPEHMNAGSSALWELTLLRKHYHPSVTQLATYVSSGGPMSDTQNLSTDLRKLATLDCFEKYDASEMAFNPPVQPPGKKVVKAAVVKRMDFVDVGFFNFCFKTLSQRESRKQFVDFCDGFAFTGEEQEVLLS